MNLRAGISRDKAEDAAAWIGLICALDGIEAWCAAAEALRAGSKNSFSLSSSMISGAFSSYFCSCTENGSEK